jgi:hypothetical protein
VTRWEGIGVGSNLVNVLTTRLGGADHGLDPFDGIHVYDLGGASAESVHG